MKAELITCRSSRADLIAVAQVTQEPEKSLGELKTLLGLCADSDAQVASWAMLSLLMVFRDILPGYRIRLPTAEEASVRVSKEVARLRGFESGLLRAYQAYLKLLLQVCHATLSSRSPPGY